MNDRDDEFRTQPLYTFGEAASIARVSPSTIRNWLRGYSAGDREVPPLLAGASDQAMVSFLHLIEIAVAARFRKIGHVSFARVRRAYDNAREAYGLDYPFAHLQLETIGGHIIHRLRSNDPDVSLQAMDRPSQWTLPGLVQELIDQLDYERDLAVRWYPAGRHTPIVVDPKISSGVPTFRGRGVTVSVVRRRWKAGQSIDYIARDFELPRDDVEKTLQYAEQIAA